MRPDRSTEKVVAFFRGKGSSGFFPREFVSRMTGLPLRTTDRALQRAVQGGDILREFSHDGCPYYAFAPYAMANPAIVEEIRRQPLRTLNQKNEELAKQSMKRWHELQITNPRAKREVDLRLQALPVEVRDKVAGKKSRVVYPSQYKSAYVCGSCGARFLSTKARRRHEASKHRAGPSSEGPSPARRARS